MIVYQELLSDLAKRESYQKKYTWKRCHICSERSWRYFIPAQDREDIEDEDVLHVPGMTINLVAILDLEDEGYDVLFFRGRVYIQKHGSGERIEIGVRDGGLYRLIAKLLKALVHDTISPIEEGAYRFAGVWRST